MQSVLLSGLRGPDESAGSELKKFTRWMRNVTQNNADPEHTYMRTDEAPGIDTEALLQEIEYSVTWHYLGHLLHALEIIAYKGAHLEQQGREAHVINNRSKFAAYWYHRLIEFMHLKPETQSEMECRLEDKVEHE